MRVYGHITADQQAHAVAVFDEYVAREVARSQIQKEDVGGVSASA
jgi:hypothetical protein